MEQGFVICLSTVTHRNILVIIIFAVRQHACRYLPCPSHSAEPVSYTHLSFHTAIHDTAEYDNAFVCIINGVKDQGF